MSRYLVTGATGFVGRHLVAELSAAGHDVVALCRSDPPSWLGALARVTVRKGDALVAPSVRDAAAGCEGVFHCAGRVSRRPEDAEALHRIHVEGTKTTLDACRDAGVRRAVVASTSGVVAVSERPEVLSEDAPTPLALVSRWPYYRSKLFAEKAAFERSAPGFDVMAVSPSLVLGPGDVNGSSTTDVASFLERKIPFVPAGGLSFVDARDAAHAMVLAMQRGRSGERYLVGAMNLTFEAFFKRLERVSGVAAPALRSPRDARLARAGAQLLSRLSKHLPIEARIDPVAADMAQHFWYLDASKAEADLGWSPRDPNDTLSDTVADLRDRGVVWPS